MAARSLLLALLALLSLFSPIAAAATERCELTKDLTAIKIFAAPNADKSSTCSFVCNLSDEANSELSLSCGLDDAQPQADQSVCTLDVNFLTKPVVRSSQRMCSAKKN